MEEPANAPKTGLILTGGGARAAYQVGVLQEIMAIRGDGSGNQTNPFPIICGTSSGAINASVLACGADRFEETLNRLIQVWSEFQVHQVYRSEILDMLRSGLGWISLILLGWMIRHRRMRPRSLLDNSPLHDLLRIHADFDRLPQMLESGHLSALAITASSYSGGEHVTFYQSQNEVQSWVRNQRLAMRCELSHQHLLASSAIPFVFPATQLEGPHGQAWYGDGAMRQTAPISPAIHLGAEKILVIGAGRMHEPRETQPVQNNDYPSMASIAGHALSSIFLDALAVDVERLQRINHTMGLIAHEHRQHARLRPIDLLVISPSERLDEIAVRHADRLPATVKNLLRVLGNSSKKTARQGGAFISYLLFESAYTQELMALGRMDARSKENEIRRFFNWPSKLGSEKLGSH
ncbi:MAG: patatin-like phospholipase family protein [Alphaproteobacteria bacterium]|nr:patatin-like phospholipase family protein [Alphaproteobacteria bacterium]